MLRLRTSDRTRFTLALCLAATALAMVGHASADVRADPPRYRYAGVVADGRGAPAHYVRRGDGISFLFSDALSHGRRTRAYQLCVGLAGKAPARCWNRKARYGIGKVVFPFTLPRVVPLGLLTARWLVAGRIVVTWPFLYGRGE
jgi:hypothetical protein